MAQFNVGDRVWLKECPEEELPREQATILEVQRNGMYTIEVEPQDEMDDGLAEIHEDDIEGLV